MHTGHYISGAGHLGLIAWLLLAGVFTPHSEPFEMQEVSIVSSEQFDAMMASSEAPDQGTDVAQPEAPDVPAETPDAPAQTEETIQQPPPVQTEAPPPDPEPPVAEPAQPPAAEVSDQAPESPEPPSDVAVLVPEVAPVAVPRPVERVAPEPVAPAEPEARPDVVEQEAVTPDAPGETVVEEPQEATAPPEATTEIVTEAALPPKAAPNQSARPPARRPTPPAPQVAARPTETPAPEPAETPAQVPTIPRATDKSAVEAALAEALGGASAESSTTPAPSGPPLSAGEKESLRVAVSSCWNVGSLSSEALRTTVVVNVEMNQDGTPKTNSILMIGSSGGSQAAAAQAFEAARRAIIRCGARGYQLPVDKFGQWQNIEMTFNPERMRIK
jgi:hypothetical protein